MRVPLDYAPVSLAGEGCLAPRCSMPSCDEPAEVETVHRCDRTTWLLCKRHIHHEELGCLFLHTDEGK